ncbi:sigma-70 family RNA polymerase sigma factor [Photobacterium sp. 53610]|uniref:sigma-70 family RNA polymerase sigma factor n=1 Tax=Photobacterium sp. 53610 TaxID=3102789 RepID=UPI002ED91869
MNEVIELNTAPESDDEKTKDKLVSWENVTSLLPWCDIIAKQFVMKHKYNHEIDFDDYRNIAVIALYDALSHFDARKGSLKSYCFTYMYHEINRCLMKSNSYLFKKVSIHAEDVSGTDMIEESPGFYTLSARLNGNRDEGEHDEAAALIYIDRYFSELSHDKQIVILEHYFNAVSLKELAARMRRTPSRISQIHQSALKELSKKLNS